MPEESINVTLLFDEKEKQTSTLLKELSRAIHRCTDYNAKVKRILKIHYPSLLTQLPGEFGRAPPQASHQFPKEEDFFFKDDPVDVKD